MDVLFSHSCNCLHNFVLQMLELTLCSTLVPIFITSTEDNHQLMLKQSILRQSGLIQKTMQELFLMFNVLLAKHALENMEKALPSLKQPDIRSTLKRVVGLKTWIAELKEDLCKLKPPSYQQEPVSSVHI